jgi:ribosomal protein S18 acetylase RimI-like enzyme
MEPDDLAGITAFLDQLSGESRYRRFFSRGTSGPLHEVDYLRSLDGHERAALVAVAGGQIIALARYHQTGSGHADVAVVVADAWQHHGIGHRLLRELTRLAIGHGVETIDVSVLGDNVAALRLLHGLAGHRPLHLDHGVFEASIPLAV